MVDASAAPPGDAGASEPAAPINHLDVPSEVYPPAPPPPPPDAPKQKRRAPRANKKAAEAVFAEQRPEAGPVNTLQDTSAFAAPPPAPPGGATPPVSVRPGGPLGPAPGAPVPMEPRRVALDNDAPPQGPPSEMLGGVIGLATLPALAGLGFKDEESAELVNGFKEALDVWTEGGVKEALPVPPAVSKTSKVIEKFMPVAQKVILPRLPNIIEALREFMPQQAAAEEPGPAAPQQAPQQAATPDYERSVPQARMAPVSVKERLKAQAGKSVTDSLSGRVVSFPDESVDVSAKVATAPSTVPKEKEWSPYGSDGPIRGPPDMAGAQRNGPVKFQFYGAKGPESPAAPGGTSAMDFIVNGQEKKGDRSIDAAAIARLPVSGPSMTPANQPDHGLAEERKDHYVPPPENLAEAMKAEPPAVDPLANIPSTHEIAQANARAKKERQPMDTPTGTPTQSRLTPDERALILGAVGKQDPNLLSGLIAAGLDVSSMALARKESFSAEQRERLRAMSFEDVLMEGEHLASTDPEFKRRWDVLVKPAGRKWLRKNLTAIQKGL